MNHKFDELAKNMAQSVTRRGAMKKFTVGLAGAVLAVLGLPNKAHAGKCLDQQCANECKKYCAAFNRRNSEGWNTCMDFCITPCFRDCI